MATEMDRVWSRIKVTARELALHEAAPSKGHAEAIVARIIREERAEVPVDARIYLAGELQAMTRAAGRP